MFNSIRRCKTTRELVQSYARALIRRFGEDAWQNAFAERLIGSIRRECVDHLIVFGERHLRRILRCYAHYYNEIRTHRSLNKDAPISRAVQRIGIVKSHAVLGGLHHHYVRI